MSASDTFLGRIGQTIPNLKVNTTDVRGICGQRWRVRHAGATEGRRSDSLVRIRAAPPPQGEFFLHDYIGDSWGILFSHPADFTPVCTTELGRVAQLASTFAEAGAKLLALSCDSVESHRGWIEDIKAFNKLEDLPYPIIADESREVATAFGMLDPELKDAKGLPVTVRSVFIINPAKKVALTLTYPASTGRNFDELLRVLRSLQLTATHSVATPADWKQGDRTAILPTVSDADAASKFPKGFERVELPSGKGYLRLTPDPSA